MICDRSDLTVNGIRINPSRGNCTTYNIIYLFICTICDKPYVGRTLDPLNIRTNQHRSAFYRILSAQKNGSTVQADIDSETNNDDIYSLGIHLVNDHNVKDKGDFNKFYRVLILSNCSPSSLEAKEHEFIHKPKSLRPSGINRTNSFSIPSSNLILSNPAVT